jgi:hypothetical protein
MSNDKKRDRALQHRVRERQAKTGESYQAAWRHLEGSEASISPSTARHVRRVPLPLSTAIRIRPGESVQITARPQLDWFVPDRFLIKNAEHWDVHELYVGSWSDAGLHNKRSLLDEPRAASCFSPDTWNPLVTSATMCGENVVLVATYIGTNKKGLRLEAVVFGWDGEPPATSRKRRFDEQSSERISERAVSERRVSANEKVTLPLTITSTSLFVDRLTITDAKDWVVNDILTRGKSIFVQDGDLPGEMFTDSARVILEPLAANDCVTVVATYVGVEASSLLAVEISGTVTPTNPASESRVMSYFLPMSTSVLIEPTQSAQITARPQKCLLPERMVIGDSENWIINDIKIGMRCQLASVGDLPGQAFSSRTIGCHMTLDPIPPGRDLIMVTTRGAWSSPDCKTSAPFYCGVQGRLVPS